MTEEQVGLGLKYLEAEFGSQCVQNAIEMIQRFKVEVPGWVFGVFGGGRFGGYSPPGAARNINEKLDDAAFVNKLTGVSDSVAMHVLWDLSDDEMEGDFKIAEKVAREARNRNLKMGSTSPTLFLKGSHRGSLSAIEKETVARYVRQNVFAGKIAEELGNKVVTIWVPDGSAYPGQVNLRDSIQITENALIESARAISKNVRILIEYKVFEPGTYSTVISDWGSSYLISKKIGDNAGVLVDLGHHHHSTNIEQIVARLIADGMKCGFHFNTRYAADDDHSVEPNGEMARIFNELVSGQVVANTDAAKNWEYMIDQCSSRENRIHAILHSIDSLQNSLAKAALLDRSRLSELQGKDEIILANRHFNNALLNADVRPIVAAARLQSNLPVDLFDEYLQSGYQQKIESERS